VQKKLLGIAVAAALVPAAAFAQPTGTGVQIYGLMDFSVNHTDYDDESSTNLDVDKGALYSSASRLGLRGRETLGMGLTAWFQAEIGVQPFRPDPNAPSQGNNMFGGRDTAVGLEGGWGTVVAGIWGSPYKVANLATWNLGTYGAVSHYGIIMNNGDSTGTEPSPNCASPTTLCGNGVMTEGGATQFGRRLSNTVQYWTPTIAGFQGRIATQFSAHKAPDNVTAPNTSTDPDLWSVSLAYVTGPFSFGAAWERHEDFTAAGAKDTAWMVGGKWTGGPFSIGAAFEQLDYGNAVAAPGNTEFKRKNFVVNGAFRFGSGELFAGYSWTPGNDDCGITLETAAALLGSNCEDATEANMLTAGYAHNLSKRTKAYVQFVQIDNNAVAGVGTTAYNLIAAPAGNAAGGTGGIVAGTDIRWIGVGVQHAF
jgi:predicted porin